MSGSNDHHHHDHRQANRRRLTITLVLVVSYMGAEIVGGLLSGSLALLADAGHMLSDAAALGLSLFALWIAARPAGSGRTYGYYRVEILSALVNGATLGAIAVVIFLEAWERLRQPTAIEGPLMLAVAVGGLVVNIVALGILHGGKDESLNLKGAWLHVVSDTLGSVQTIVAAVLVWAFGWTWADPVASVLIALLVVYSAWGLLKEAVAVLMEAAPGHIDVDEVRAAMIERPGVGSVHDLHVWTITTGLDCLSAHLVVEPGYDGQELLAATRRRLLDRFGIDHVTIQLETVGCERGGCPGEEQA